MLRTNRCVRMTADTTRTFCVFQWCYREGSMCYTHGAERAVAIDTSEKKITYSSGHDCLDYYSTIWCAELWIRSAYMHRHNKGSICQKSLAQQTGRVFLMPSHTYGNEFLWLTYYVGMCMIVCACVCVCKIKWRDSNASDCLAVDGIVAVLAHEVYLGYLGNVNLTVGTKAQSHPKNWNIPA